MRRDVFKLVFMALLSISVLLSGCGSSKTNSAGSSGQSSSANSTTDVSSQDANPSSSPADATTGSFAEQMSITWVDNQSDIVAPTAAKPDGVQDGHFHLSLQLPKPVLIESVFIRYSEFGKEFRWDWIYNNHLTPAGYYLAVYEQGTLIPAAPDTGIKKSGNIEWDLFAAGLNNAKGRDTLSFDSGSHFTIEVNYTTQTGERKRWSSKVSS